MGGKPARLSRTRSTGRIRFSRRVVSTVQRLQTPPEPMLQPDNASERRQSRCCNQTTPPNAARADATARQRLRSQESPLLQSNKAFGGQTDGILHLSMCFGRLTDAMFDLYMSFGGPPVVLLSCYKWFVRPTNVLSCGRNGFSWLRRRCAIKKSRSGRARGGSRPRKSPSYAFCVRGVARSAGECVGRGYFTLARGHSRVPLVVLQEK